MHDHPAPEYGRGDRQLLVALVVNLTIMVAEIIGGIVSGSLALITDAGHMLVDATALGIAFVGSRVARRPPDARMTYGYRRFEILSALANGALLAGLMIGLIVRAVVRLAHPSPVEAGVMTGVAALGLAANGVSILILRRHRHESINLQAAFLHVLSDAVSSVAVIAAGAFIAATRWYAADPIASLFIAALILRQVWVILRKTVTILLEGVPPHLEFDEVRRAILNVRGVQRVTDLHVTTHAGSEFVLTAHVVVHDGLSLTETTNVLNHVRRLLVAEYEIGHVTLEPETAGSSDTHAHRCDIPVRSE